ncbi:leucine-rich_repeat domain-containing protein [Hexamita inflata]|uniref:Leucine-rich repeat domain-containing protein n=1 Tax=Hexamita inflata TaxID=28002 RepID=A0AA86NFK1_9EUKA|nr:leucine-rich repeat domain-containing protein [Hexamita inflata]
MQSNIKNQQELEYEKQLMDKYLMNIKQGVFELKFDDYLENIEFMQNLDISKLILCFCSKVVPKLNSDTIKELNISYCDVQSIKEMNLKNLEVLTLDKVYNNHEELANYPKLKELTISSRRIQDFSFLNSLNSLTKLKLSSDSISDISALKQFTNLLHIDLSYNQIKDVSPLEFLTQLTYLNLYCINYSREVENIQRLKLLVNLEYFNIGDNNCTDVEVVQNFHQLKCLNLAKVDQKRDDCTETYLKCGLRLNRYLIRDLLKKEQQQNMIYGIPVWQNLTDLVELDLSYIFLSDISSLRNLTTIEKLDIKQNTIENISTLQYLTNMKELNISNNSISDISPLRHLKQLTKLYASENNLDNVSVVQNLINITHIDISENYIVYVYPIADLKNLQQFKISENFVLDFDVLKVLGLEPIIIPRTYYYGGARPYKYKLHQNAIGKQFEPPKEMVNTANKIRCVDQTYAKLYKVNEYRNNLKRSLRDIQRNVEQFLNTQIQQQIAFTQNVITLFSYFNQQTFE